MSHRAKLLASIDRNAPSEEDLAVRQAAQRERVEARDAELRRANLEASLAPRYRPCRLNNFQVQCDAQRRIRNGLATVELAEMIRGGGGLFFLGPCGTGKDHLAAAMLRRSVDLGFAALAVNGMALFTQFKESYDRGGETSVLVRYFKPDVVLLSDPVVVGAPPTPDNRRNLYRLVHGRYEQDKSTWITINAANRDQAIELLTMPIFDRLMHRALPVFCNWPSYRQENKWATGF